MGSSLYWGQEGDWNTARFLSLADIHFHSIATGKLRRYFLAKYVGYFQGLLGNSPIDLDHASYGRRFRFLKEVSSVPPVVAFARLLLFVPVLVHESDRSMGLANKLPISFGNENVHNL